MEDFTTLQLIWFILISVLWIGYFVLEGFDFGVGILMKTMGRDENEKRAILHSIGPVWDGNEVWLLVAGGATFAAFPQWYATLFSGFYLALFVILVALILRNVGFEFWGKRDSKAWRTGWEWCILIGSAVPALLWGVAWANIIGGTPINAEADFTGNFFDLLSAYTLLGGLATLAIFFAHGAIFLSMRTEGSVRVRAENVARTAILPALAIPAVWLIWTLGRQDPVEIPSLILAALAVVSLGAATVLVRKAAWQAFVGTTVAIIMFFSSIFTYLFPNTMISSTSSAFDMSLNFSSSSEYTLTVMTVVAVLFVPLVLVYQGWTYWVFRHRISAEGFGDVKTPLDLLDKRKREGGDGTDRDPGSGQQPTSP